MFNYNNKSYLNMAICQGSKAEKLNQLENKVLIDNMDFQMYN